MPAIRINWNELGKHVGIFLTVVGIGACLVVGGIWMKFGSHSSDYKRLKSLESRVEAIEERAGSCEVVPLE